MTTPTSSGLPSLAKSMLPLLAARGATQLGSAIVSILVARSVGPDRFGVFAGILAISAIVVGGSTSGLPLLAMRRAATGRGTRRFALSLCAAATRIGLAAALLTIPINTALFGARNALILGSIAAAGSISLTALTTLSAIRSGQQKYLVSAAGELCGSLTTVALAGLALGLGLGSGGALVALAAGPLVGALIILRDLKASSVQGQSRPRVAVRELLPFIALGFASTGYLRVDVLTLSAFVSQKEVGYYAAAYRILGVFTLLGSAFGTVFFSRISARGGDLSELRRACTRFSLLTGIPAAIAFILASQVISAVFGEAYTGAVGPLRVLLLATVPYGLYWPIALYLNALGWERQFAVILAAGAITDVALIALTAPSIGATGASAAWALSETLTLVLCVVLIWRVRGESRAARPGARWWLRDQTRP